jgi:iron complex outermembrane receptor protein
VNKPSSESVTFSKTLVAQSVSAALLASATGGVAAQEIEEVIVTATKRSENIQDVPLAITAMTGSFVRDVNLDDVKDLVTFTPGVTGNSTDAFIDGISVRGIRTQDFGVGGDPSAAFFKNNLYEGRNGAVVTSLYDLERAEVLRGPQGFLFGRNAIGGAFSVHTKRPTLDGGSDSIIEVDVAERNHVSLEGATNVGVSENFALRLAGYHSSEDGYVRNAFDGRDYLGYEKTAARISGLWSSGNAEVFATAEYEDMDRDGSAYRVNLLSPRLVDLEGTLGAFNMPADPRGINSDLFEGSADDAQMLSLGLHVDYDFENMALSWSSGYKDHDYFYTEDYDGTPRNLGVYQQEQSGDYLQSELRLTSDSDGPLSWYAGVSFYEENIDYRVLSSLEEEAICSYYGSYYGVSNCTDYFQYWQDYWDYYYYPGYITVGPFVPTANGMMEENTFINGKYRGWAAYVDLTMSLGEMWDVSVGVRYTYDEKTFSTRVPKPDSTLLGYFLPGYMTSGLTDKNDWSDTTPRVILRFTPADDHMMFGSYTKGYKSGGFGTFSIVDAITNEPVFQWFGEGDQDPLGPEDGVIPGQFRPEDVTSYEIGYKGLLADGSVQLDVTAFLYDYTDLQVNYFDQGSKVDNVGQVDGQGIEGSVQWAINENWDFRVAAGYLKTEAYGLQNICGGAPDPANDFLPDGDPDGCEGNPLPWAPEFMGSAVLRGAFPLANGEIVGNVETFWESERGGSYEALPWGPLPSYQEWALRLGYHSNNDWYATAYVENLTDELTYANSQINSGITPDWYVGPNRPRTVGLRVGYSFD